MLYLMTVEVDDVADFGCCGGWVWVGKWLVTGGGGQWQTWVVNCDLKLDVCRSINLIALEQVIWCLIDHV